MFLNPMYCGPLDTNKALFPVASIRWANIQQGLHWVNKQLSTIIHCTLVLLSYYSWIRYMKFWKGYYCRWNPRMRPQDSVHLRHAQLLSLRDQLQAKVGVGYCVKYCTSPYCCCVLQYGLSQSQNIQGHQRILSNSRSFDIDYAERKYTF